MPLFPQTCAPLFKDPNMEGTYEVLASWIIVREFKRVFQTKSDMDAWDKEITNIFDLLRSGKQTDLDAAEARFEKIESMIGDLKEPCDAVMNALIDSDPSKPFPGVDGQKCTVNWPVMACSINGLAVAAKISRANLDAAIQNGLAGYWPPGCEPAVLEDAAYACSMPPCAPTEKKTNWTAWILGGAAAVAALGGVAYVATRPYRPSRASELAHANPAGQYRVEWYTKTGKPRKKTFKERKNAHDYFSALTHYGMPAELYSPSGTLLEFWYPTHGKGKPHFLAANPSRKRKAPLPRFSLAMLKTMPVLEQGHTDNLYYNDGTYKVWLSRMTKADGAPYNNQITIEQLIGGVWQEIETYQAR